MKCRVEEVITEAPNVIWMATDMKLNEVRKRACDIESRVNMWQNNAERFQGSLLWYSMEKFQEVDSEPRKNQLPKLTWRIWD